MGERKLYKKDRSRAHLGDGRGLRKWGRTQGKWTWRYSPLDPIVRSILFIMEMPRVVGKGLGYRKWLSWFSAGWGVGVELQEQCWEIKGWVRARMTALTNGVRPRGHGAQC